MTSSIVEGSQQKKKNNRTEQNKKPGGHEIKTCKSNGSTYFIQRYIDSASKWHILPCDNGNMFWNECISTNNTFTNIPHNTFTYLDTKSIRARLQITFLSTNIKINILVIQCMFVHTTAFQVDFVRYFLKMNLLTNTHKHTHTDAVMYSGKIRSGMNGRNSVLRQKQWRNKLPQIYTKCHVLSYSFHSIYLLLACLFPYLPILGLYSHHYFT